jgi:mycothiol synthase
VHLRPLASEDAVAIHGVVRACETADRIPIVTPIVEIQEMFEATHFDAEIDSVGVEIDGQLVGWSHTWHEPSGERLERAYLSGHVVPPFRNQGIGTELVAWGVERATAQLRACSNGLPLYVRANGYSWQDDVADLLTAAGFTSVRWDDELVRTLDSVVTPRSVEGVEIVPWQPEHHEPCRAVKNAAFADHWGSTPASVEGWLTRITEAGTRVDLSFVALAGDEVVGICLNASYPDDELVTGRRDGWIGTLGVRREWRAQGIASALIEHSLSAFRASGMSHAMLAVDTDNPTGAAGLYRSLGFEPLHRSTTFELDVTDQA